MFPRKQQKIIYIYIYMYKHINTHHYTTDIIIMMLNILQIWLCIVEKIRGIVLCCFSATEVLQMGRTGNNSESSRQAKGTVWSTCQWGYSMDAFDHYFIELADIFHQQNTTDHKTTQETHKVNYEEFKKNTANLF